MKAVAAHELLESLATVTAERDQARFRTSLSRTIRELLPVDDVLFVSPRTAADGRMALHHFDHGERVPGQAPSRPLPVRPEHLEQLLAVGQVLAMEDGQATLMLPVAHREALVEIVVVRAPSIPAEVLYLLKGFARLYRNFLALILESERDPLTGLFNRRTLETRLAELARSAAQRLAEAAHDGDDRRVGQAAGQHFVAMIDLDHFKRINDTLGHLFGDEVLLLVAHLMREAFRDEDLLFRYGGEELVVVLVAQSLEGTLAALERFRERVATRRFPQLNQVTVSIGVSAMRGHELPSAAIARADQALYCAKQDGRDRVCEYDALVAAGRIGAVAAGHGAELF